MATAIKRQTTTTLQNINRDDLFSVFEEQIKTLPRVFDVVIFPIEKAKIKKKEEEKPKGKIYTPEEIKAWADSLPTMELTDEQSKSIDEGIKDIEEGRCKIMTVDEIMKEVTS